MPTPTSPTQPKTKWLTTREAAAYARCSVSIISRAVNKTHTLSAVRLDPGNSQSALRFTTEDIDRWLERGRVDKPVTRRKSA